MQNDTIATRLAGEYQSVLKRASGKTYNKWRPYLAGQPLSSRPFGCEDLDQWALEGLLILAGCMPGSNHGKLAEYQREPRGEAFIQRSIDMHIADKCQKAVQKHRAVKRGGGSIPAYLNSPVGETGQTLADVISARNLETDSRSIPNVAKKYPILWATAVLHVPDRDVRASMGISSLEYNRRKNLESEIFFRWAVRNRRVSEDCDSPQTYPPCPYGDPGCTGRHSTGVPKDEMCPTVYAAKCRAR